MCGYWHSCLLGKGRRSCSYSVYIKKNKRKSLFVSKTTKCVEKSRQSGEGGRGGMDTGPSLSPVHTKASAAITFFFFFLSLFSPPLSPLPLLISSSSSSSSLAPSLPLYCECFLCCLQAASSEPSAVDSPLVQVGPACVKEAKVCWQRHPPPTPPSPTVYNVKLCRKKKKRKKGIPCNCQCFFYPKIIKNLIHETAGKRCLQ